MTTDDGKNKNQFDKIKNEANALMHQDKLDDALSHYTKAVEINPNYAEGYCNIGLIHLKNGRFDQAEKNLLIAVQRDENLTEAYFNLGMLYQEKGTFPKALAFYKEVVVRNPQDFQTYLRMGLCSQSERQLDSAQSFFEEAFRLQPDSLEAGAALAGLYIDKKNYEKAEEVLKVNLVSYPEEIPLLFSLGLILKEQKKYESALAQFNKVVNLNDSHAAGFFHLADCCKKLGLYKQAEPFFAKAYKLDDTSPEPVYELGLVYEQMKKMDLAVVMFKKWIEMMEQQLSLFNEDQKEQFINIADKLVAYYETKGDQDKSDYFKSLKNIADGNQKNQPEPSKTNAKDYRVSLQIED